MNQQDEEAALEIGKVIRAARLDKGYKSRAALVDTKKLKGTITQEGLRKIEEGERIPRLENLRRIAEALGLKEKTIRQLERKALKANVRRVAKRAGNATVSFRIEGEPLRVTATPPKRKVEFFVRGVVEKLVAVVDKYGVLPEDLIHFRRNARHILLKDLENT